MTATKIEWSDEVWNPVTGCSRVSSGCDHCYAVRQSHRLEHMGQDEYAGLTVLNGKGDRHFNGEVRCHEDRLETPLRWRKPRRVFVNSMSDLFHPGVPFEFIDRVFAVMALTPHITYMILTKRPERMAEYLNDDDRPFVWEDVEFVHRAKYEAAGDDPPNATTAELERARLAGSGLRRITEAQAGTPLPNVWLGTSVEDQAAADERIPHLLRCPAAVRFLSMEPLLGPVDLGLQSAKCECCPRWPSRWVRLPREVRSDFPFSGTTASPGVYRATGNHHGALSVKATDGSMLGIRLREFECLPAVDWVIVGGESGPGARPCDVDWIRSIIRQCDDAGVPVFVKQLGAWPYDPGWYGDGTPEGSRMEPNDRKGGDPDEWPENLRRREFPNQEATA
jgi:protein gp37